MNKYLYGYYNRKTNCYENFYIFENLDQLCDYEKSLYRCSKDKRCADFEFSNYTLYPEDYSVFCLGIVDYNPDTYTDWLKPCFENCGDFDDLLGVKKDNEDDNKEAV